VVPTVIAYHGNFYISNLGTFPQDAGSSNVWKVTPSGQIRRDAGGFNLVLGLAFDHRDRMYVLETSAPPAPTPGTGRIVRVSSNGKSREVIVDGLFFATGMTFGPDGNLYVSNVGFGPPPVGMGQILKVELHD
jgi:sugar lactone lactonase YvrE